MKNLNIRGLEQSSVGTENLGSVLERSEDLRSGSMKNPAEISKLSSSPKILHKPQIQFRSEEMGSSFAKALPFSFVPLTLPRTRKQNTRN